MNELLPSDLDRIGEIPPRQGVFLIETDGEPYINKSADLRRRVARLIEPATETTKRLSLHDAARRVLYRETGSQFESALLLWKLNREYFPGSYRRRVRLRPPMLLKLNLQNEYPRCYLTRRLGRGPSIYFGPFPSRTAADKFAQAFLDLFLIRRCVEAIHPDPAHPGCIYGEMKMCLRPCQAATTHDAYIEETARVQEFLTTQGGSVLKVLESDRERAATDLEFERAAEIHKRLEKAKAALDFPELANKGGLATDLEHLHGIVVQRSAIADSVELFPVYRGFLLDQVTFSTSGGVETSKPVSLDSRLRERLTGLSLETNGRRWEQIALLSRWFYRGSRKGEFVAFDSFDRIPYRRLVNAIGRVARANVENVGGASDKG